jgi:hypothetical protein
MTLPWRSARSIARRDHRTRASSCRGAPRRQPARPGSATPRSSHIRVVARRAALSARLPLNSVVIVATGASSDARSPVAEFAARQLFDPLRELRDHRLDARHRQVEPGQPQLHLIEQVAQRRGRCRTSRCRGARRQVVVQDPHGVGRPVVVPGDHGAVDALHPPCWCRARATWFSAGRSAGSVPACPSPGCRAPSRRSGRPPSRARDCR